MAFPNKTIDSDKLLNWALRHNSQVKAIQNIVENLLPGCALVAIATSQEHGPTKEPRGAGLYDHIDHSLHNTLSNIVTLRP